MAGWLDGWLPMATSGAVAPPAPLGLAGQAAPVALSAPQVQVPASLSHPRRLLLRSWACLADLSSRGGGSTRREKLRERLGLRGTRLQGPAGPRGDSWHGCGAGCAQTPFVSSTPLLHTIVLVT